LNGLTRFLEYGRIKFDTNRRKKRSHPIARTHSLQAMTPMAGTDNSASHMLLTGKDLQLLRPTAIPNAVRMSWFGIVETLIARFQTIPP
jgi:hypothetical protein